MQKKRLATYYLILGIILFPLGLLMLLGQPSLLNLMVNIMPSTQTIEIFGVIILFLGEGLLCYGIVNAVVGRVADGAELNRQNVVEGVVRNVQEQVNQLNTRLDQIQQTGASRLLPATRANCQFCGAKMGDGRFCPACGRAQA
jgi:hypothetical protein